MCGAVILLSCYRLLDKVMSNNLLGICAWFVPGADHRAKMQFVKDCGLDGIELDFNHANGVYGLTQLATQQSLLAMREEFSLAFPAMAVNSLCEFGMSNPKDKSRAQQDIAAAIEVAQVLSIPIVQLPSFFAGDIETDAQFTQSVENMQFACDCAASAGITIGSENALSGERQLALVTQVARDNFKIYFDARNSMWMKGLASPPILSSVLAHICEVHLKDGIAQQEASVPLGEGDAGIAEVITMLREAAYNKWILLENNYHQPNDIAVAKAQVQADMQYIRQHMSLSH